MMKWDPRIDDILLLAMRSDDPAGLLGQWLDIHRNDADLLHAMARLLMLPLQHSLVTTSKNEVAR